MREKRLRHAYRCGVIAGLLRGAERGRCTSEAELLATARRWAARQAWWRQLFDDYRAAARRCDAAWMKALEPYDDWPEEAVPELDPPPEQAEVDRLHALIADVRDHGRWPRHLHWTV